MAVEEQEQCSTSFQDPSPLQSPSLKALAAAHQVLWPQDTDKDLLFLEKQKQNQCTPRRLTAAGEVEAKILCSWGRGSCYRYHVCYCHGGAETTMLEPATQRGLGCNRTGGAGLLGIPHLGSQSTKGLLDTEAGLVGAAGHLTCRYHELSAESHASCNWRGGENLEKDLL